MKQQTSKQTNKQKNKQEQEQEQEQEQQSTTTSTMISSPNQTNKHTKAANAQNAPIYGSKQLSLSIVYYARCNS